MTVWWARDISRCSNHCLTIRTLPDSFQEYNRTKVVQHSPITKEGTMEDSDKAEFEIQVSIKDATDEELDRSTRQLLADLRELDVESAELTKRGSAPTGTKSADPVIMGNIAVAMISSVLPKVVEVVQAWSTRGQG